MKYFVESIHADNGQKNYLAACRASGLDVREVLLTEDYATQFAGVADPVFGFGSIQMVDELSKFGVKNRSYANWSQFACLAYYPIFGDYLLNRDYVLLPFGDILRQRWEIFARFAVDTAVFFRPNEGTKSFSGSVIDLQYLESQIKSWAKYGAKDADLVLISRPAQIQGEWRFAITNHNDEREILGVSLYRYQGNTTYVASAPKPAYDFVLEVLNKTKIYTPDPIYMLDIALLLDGTYRVVECNSLSSSAPYAMDVLPVVQKLKTYIK